MVRIDKGKSSLAGIEETLPALQRLAMAYCRAPSRAPTLALLSLDTRLAGIVRSASEPMLAQIRLAWWREAFSRPPAEWARGEPLLELLNHWEEETASLSSLVDAWEAIAAEQMLSAQSLGRLADARGRAFVALARIVGAQAYAADAMRMAGNWAIADIASRLTVDEERQIAVEIAAQADWTQARLPRSLRPLAVLHGLARRAVSRGSRLDRLPATSLFPVMRIGLFGR